MTTKQSNGTTCVECTKMSKENQDLRNRLFKVETYLHQIIEKTLANRRKEAEKAEKSKKYPYTPLLEPEYRSFQEEKVKTKKRGIDFIRKHYQDFQKQLNQ